MAEPYSEQHQEIAEKILGEAFEALTAAGLDHVEACHAIVHVGLDTLPAFACACCLEGEYDAIAEAVATRIAAIPEMTEIARPPEVH